MSCDYVYSVSIRDTVNWYKNWLSSATVCHDCSTYTRSQLQEHISVIHICSVSISIMQSAHAIYLIVAAPISAALQWKKAAQLMRPLFTTFIFISSRIWCSAETHETTRDRQPF